MDKIIIEGGSRLQGEVRISGSKNASLPILAASLLTDEKVSVRNIPDLLDISHMMLLLGELGLASKRLDDGTIEITPEEDTPVEAPYDIVRKMRASVCVLGPLLAKRRRARVSLPGGCVIGLRPIDLHLKGLRALGATIDIEHGYIVAEAGKLRGSDIFLGGPFGSTVLGTANVMMAATLAEGTTTIESAACEPEVADLANFLNAMGANISGVGTPRLVIKGVKALKGAEHSVIPDRIEAGTYLIAAAATGGEVSLRGARFEHLGAVIDKLRQVDVTVTREGDGCRLRSNGRVSSVEVTTHAYPGFPTDLQAQMMALLSIGDGISIVTEKIYPDRYMHIAELNRMGARIRKEGASAIIQGVHALSGAPVMASDLRASAALLVAGLVAKGTTTVNRVYHIDRGYESVEKKFASLGARIKRVSDDEVEDDES
jgi:UDP-N-acetylglucosamine 1-carboxyvinyltransferase